MFMRKARHRSASYPEITERDIKRIDIFFVIHAQAQYHMLCPQFISNSKRAIALKRIYYIPKRIYR